jgi:hypothetical protein
MAARISKTADEPRAETPTPRTVGNPGTLAAARRRSMSERLELALSWNAVASELQAGLAGATGRASDRP